jgi:hypothetical protein
VDESREEQIKLVYPAVKELVVKRSMLGLFCSQFV